MPAEYDTTRALARIILLDPDDTDGQREALRGLTLIPEDRLDTCLAEIREVFPALRPHLDLITLLLGHKPTEEELGDWVPRAVWIDDDKGNITVNISAQTEDGEELATATARRNYKTGEASVEFHKP